MTLRYAYVAVFASLALLAGAATFANGQAFAEEVVTPVPVDPCEDIFPNIPNMPGCGDEGGGDEGGGTENPPVDPCEDIFPNIPNMPECGGDDDNGGGGEEEPTDVCSNIDGVQTEVPSGKVQSGTECVDAPTGGGGGSSGGSSGGGGGGSGGGGGGGSVLGTTTPAFCEPHITTFMRRGQVNDAEQVLRMQGILKMFEGMEVEETGEYDEKSEAAIKAFQLKYASEILTPWAIQEPTGYVFLTTRKKLNEVYCQNTQAFPLTEEEQGHIELVKNATAVTPVAKSPAPAAPQQAPVETQEGEVSTEETVEETTPVRGNRITDFFRRLFDRLR